jgi:hypothetical protein
MDVRSWYDWRSMGKKRLIVDLLDADHAELAGKAREAGMTISNFVRLACGLPLEHQGKKRAETVSQAKTKRSVRIRKRKAGG